MSVCNPCGGGIRSGAQITFFARSQHYEIGDYYVYPGFFSMIATYSPSDSILNISGDGSSDPTGTISAQIGFVVRSLPYPSSTQNGLPDTGTFLLDMQTVPSQFWQDTVKINPHVLEGGASVQLRPDTDKNGIEYTYSTDEKHTGMLRITSIDTVNNLFSGTFSFWVIDTLTSDTVRIDSGVISKMRL